MKRYSVNDYGGLISDDEGVYVLHSDHEAAMAELRERLAAAEKDAGRYKHLRCASGSSSPFEVLHWGAPRVQCLHAERLDAAIDSAIKSEEG